MTSSARSNQPLVTIVTPSFNQGQFIAEAIDSVLAQDYPAIEYVVMDGGSTDGTLDVLRRYGDRLRWSSAPDAGQADAIHRGFMAGTGDYLAWLNSDDRYLPGAVSAAVAELRAHPEIALVYGKVDFIDRAGAWLSRPGWIRPWDLSVLIEDGDYIVQPATMFRRDAYVTVGGLNTALRYTMDYDLWIRLGQSHGAMLIDRLMAEARAYGDTKTSMGGLARLDEIERVARAHGAKGMPKAFRRELWVALTRAARSAARNGQLVRATRLTARAAGLAPRAMSWKLRRALRHS